MTPVIYTIGHSNAPAEKIVDLLSRYEIKTLVDVRSVPYSRFNPQFNRKAFENTLQQAGIDYQYAGDLLGGRPSDPTCYKDGQIPTRREDFPRQLDYAIVMSKDFFQEGIRRLLELAEQRRVAILCSEENPANCHRHHLIGRYLAPQGVSVLHIRGNGDLIGEQDLPDSQPPPSAQLSLL